MKKYNYSATSTVVPSNFLMQLVTGAQLLIFELQ